MTTNDASYAGMFDKAIAMSRHRGFMLPAWGASPTPKLESSHIQQQLHTRLEQVMGTPMNIAHVARRCVNVHARLLTDAAAIVGVMPVFTVGSVIFDDGEPCFSCSWKELDEWMTSSAIQREMTPARFHAWLTIPGMQIIDFTLEATFFEWKYMESFGVIARPATMIQGFSYRPVAVGNDLPIRLAG